jgi:hypothetical protein
VQHNKPGETNVKVLQVGKMQKKAWLFEKVSCTQRTEVEPA